MRDDPAQRSEINNRLCQGEVHERTRRLEVELDQAFWVESRVCAHQTAIRGVQAGSGGVDEDGCLAGAAGVVKMGEKGLESAVAEVVAFVVGLEVYARGFQSREGVVGFGDSDFVV
jgi:hypothetical protein